MLLIRQCKSLNNTYDNLTVEEIDNLIDELVEQFRRRLIPHPMYEILFTELNSAAKRAKVRLRAEAYKRAMSVI